MRFAAGVVLLCLAGGCDFNPLNPTNEHPALYRRSFSLTPNYVSDGGAEPSYSFSFQYVDDADSRQIQQTLEAEAVFTADGGTISRVLAIGDPLIPTDDVGSAAGDTNLRLTPEQQVPPHAGVTFLLGPSISATFNEGGGVTRFPDGQWGLEIH